MDERCFLSKKVLQSTFWLALKGAQAVKPEASVVNNKFQHSTMLQELPDQS